MGPVDVAICIASFRRPDGLAALLRAIAEQTFAGPAPSLAVVIVDNDAEASARAVAERARAELSLPIDYRVEPRRGIPHARNAALAAALERARWIAFIDDDELPTPGWLDALLAVAERTGADVVTGPVVPRFAAAPARWIAEGGFFASPRHADGARVGSASTNNALVRTRCLLETRARFDERFVPLGEDIELFERLAASGRAIAWADAAIVYDVVPPQRATLRWILTRAWRAGSAHTRVDRAHAARGVAGGVLFVALRGMALGTARALGAFGLARRAQGLQIASYGAGRARGLLGRV